MELLCTAAYDAGGVVAGYRSATDGNRMYVAKYLNNGSLVWELDLPSDAASAVRHIQLDGDGNVYVAGTEEALPGAPPIHIARISPQGDLSWHHTFDAEGGTEVELNGMTVGANALYLIGSENDDAGIPMAWAASFDLSGDLNWKTAFDQGPVTAFYDIAENGQGGIAACGSSDSDYTNLLVGFGADGSVSWSWPSTLTGSYETWMTDITADAQGNWIVIGTLETDNSFEFDAVTYKFEPNGTFLWDATFHNEGENNGSQVRVAPNGNILSFINEEYEFDENVRVIAYDPQGNELWGTDLMLDDHTSVVNAAVTASGEIFVGIADYDLLAVAKLSSSGSLLGTFTIEPTEVDYFSDVAVNGSHVFGCIRALSHLRSLIFSVNGLDLQQDANVLATGSPMSDVRASALASDGSAVWMAHSATTGDSTTYSVTKLDAFGNELWTRGRRHPGSNPVFRILTHDNAGNCIGFLQNLVSGNNTLLELVKYAPDGDEVFTVLFDSTATLRASSITTDPVDNIYVNGYNETTRRMFLARYTPTGSLVWMEHYTSPSTTFPYAEAKLMTYTQQDKLVLGSIHKNAANVNNLYLFQYDADGTLEWHTEVGPQSGNQCDAVGLHVDDAGKVTFFGSSGTGSAVAAAFSSTGIQIWSQSEALASTVAPRSLAVDAVGNAYLGYSSNNSARFKKMGPTGALLASQQLTLGTSGAHYFPYRTALIGDRLAVVGEHLHPAGTVPFEMLLDDELNLLNGRVDSLEQGAFSGSDHHANTIQVVYTKGVTYGLNHRSAFVRQYSIGTVGLAETDPEVPGLHVFPNPMTDMAQLVCTDLLSPGDRVRISDLNGRVVAEEKGNGTDTILLDRGSLAPGTYLVQVLRSNGRHARALVVME